MINLDSYLSLTTMMILATKDPLWNPYTANLYFKCDKQHNFYFLSKVYREHSQHILKDKNIARSIINTQKYQEEDPDKKWLQFQWTATMLTWKEFEKISSEIYGNNTLYDSLKDTDSRIYKCTPIQVKIRDEEIYWWDWFIYTFDH